MLVSIGKRIGLHRVPALYRLYHRFLDREPHVLNMPDRDIMLRTDGQRFWVANPRESHIGRSIYLRGIWEPEATAVLDQMVRPGMIAVDVGAHTGYYTILLAKRVGPSGRVLAFEPEQRGLKFLHRNVAANGYRNVEVHSIALADASAACHESAGAFLSRSEAAAPSGDGQPTMTTKAFDEFRHDGDVDRVDFMKIDVEGAELQVLRGMRHTLATFRPVLLLEIHPKGLRLAGADEKQLHAFLESHGYATTLVTPPSKSSGVYTVRCDVKT